MEKFNSDMACTTRLSTRHSISACISLMENSNFESESTDVDYSLEIDKIWIFKSNSIIKIPWACMYFEILRQWNPQLENSYKLEWTWAIRFFENSVRSCTKKRFETAFIKCSLASSDKCWKSSWCPPHKVISKLNCVSIKYNTYSLS